MRAPEGNSLRRQVLAADDKDPAALLGVRPAELAAQHIQVCGRQLDEAEVAVRSQHLGQAFDAGRRRNQLNGRAGEQWHEQAGHGQVEDQGGMQRSAGAALARIGARRPGEVI